MKRIILLLSENVKLTIITTLTDDLDSIENIRFEFIERVSQSYTIIDNQIVWYGNINPLSYNRVESSVLRLINASLAGKLKNEVFDSYKLC